MRLSVLGPPGLVRGDGSPAGLAPGKTMAVLVYLAHATSPPSRADLVQLFWPNSEPPKSRHSVRQTLSLIRKVIGEEAFASDDPVSLRSGALSTDTQDFLEALREGEIETADRLWRGTFVEGLVLADAPEWTRWVEERQLALENRLCEALTTEAEAARFRSDQGADRTAEDAIHLLRRAISVDPYRERPRVVLADLLVKQGKLDEAANEIAEARLALGEDTTGLQALDRQIESEIRHRYAAGQADPAPALGELFVGRTSEMGRLIGAWARAEQGVVTVALVEGPAGIGKTRLSRELAAHVHGRGGIVAFTSPLPAEASIASGVLRDLEGQLVEGVARFRTRADGSAGPGQATSEHGQATSAHGQEKSAHGQEKSATAGDVAAGGVPHDEVAAAERLEERLLRLPAPALVVVDDFQWADPFSRSVLARVGRRLTGAPCLFLFTGRPEAEDREVQETLHSLAESPSSVWIELGPLSDDEARELLALAARIEELEADGSLERLLLLAGGSPLYVIELLRTLAETGVIAADASGQLQLAGPLPDPLPFPKGMRELLERRLAALPDEAITVAAHLAAAGGRTGVDGLREATGLPTPAYSRALGTLLEREVIRWAAPTKLAFTHEEVRRIVARRFPLAAEEAKRNARHRSRRRERRLGLAAMALASVPLVLLAVSLMSRGPEPGFAPVAPPYGGGSIVLVSEREIVELRPSANPAGEWTQARIALPAPELNEHAGPFLTTSGKRVLFGRVLEEGVPPRLVRILPDGSVRDVARSAWDEGRPSLSPDGEFVAWERARVDGDRHSHEIRIARADGSEPRVLMQSDWTLGVSGWSPSGRHILVTLAGPDADSLLVVSPLGARRAAWPFQDEVDAAWCGQTDRFAVRGIRQGKHGLWLGSPLEADLTPAAAGEPLAYPIACSPDASGIVYARAVDGRMRLVLLDVASGGFEPLPPGAVARGGLAWLPDSLAPVTVSLQIAPDSLIFDWGATLRVEADVERSDGSPGPAAIAWRSADPAVVSVRPDGTVTGNGPGVTVVTAEAEGWIRDSIIVEVLATDRPDVLLQEDFAALRPERWIQYGSPPAGAVRRGDTTAVALRGDGVYHDGVLSRDPFTLTGGATLEAEFRLPLRGTRSQGAQGTQRAQGAQRVQLCLIDTGPDTDPDLAEWDDVQILPAPREAACFTYPNDELSRLQPDEAELSAAGWRQAVRIPEDLPSEDWVHVTVQVRGDGMPFFFVNRRLVGAGPLRLTGLDNPTWHVNLTGKAFGTELLVRRLVVWRGARFVPFTWSLDPIDDASHSFSVWASSESSVWVAGGYRFLRHFDGTAWSTPLLPAGTANTTTVFGFSESEVYLAGQRGVERFDGREWTTVLGGVGELFGIWGTGASDLFVSGDGRFLHFDGSQWTDIPTGLSTEFNTDRLLTVWGTASNNVYVGGYGGRILHWDGSQLTQVLHVPGWTVHAIHGTGPDDVFAVGPNGSIWHFDGSAWSRMSSGTTVNLGGVSALSPMEVYVVGSRGTLLRFDGSSWVAETSGTSRRLRSIFGLSPNRMYVAVQGAILSGTR